MQTGHHRVTGARREESNCGAEIGETGGAEASVQLAFILKRSQLAARTDHQAASLASLSFRWIGASTPGIAIPVQTCIIATYAPEVIKQHIAAASTYWRSA
jgi:hypothetical protein